MNVVQVVGDGDHSLVKTIIAGLVASDQKNGRSTRIEREKCANWPSTALGAKLLHVSVPGALDGTCVRPAKRGSDVPQQLNASRQRVLFGLAQLIPPIAEF